MKEENIVQTPLTIREKMVIHLLIVLIKVIKPFDWDHELDKSFEEIKEFMKKGA